MSTSLRLSEKWFRRGLWGVAILFAGFLIGLGGTLVNDLPRVERERNVNDFVDESAATPVRAALSIAQESLTRAGHDSEQAELKLQVAKQASANARETFENWLATRHATQQPDQDAALIARTLALDSLKTQEESAQGVVNTQHERVFNATQPVSDAQQNLDALMHDADTKNDLDMRKVALRVFGYRLALTLPLLAFAGWLFARKRKSIWWPFVWGFIFFALFTFFVELVPYMPSYGGYVRYVVGIVVTVLLGRYAIVALNAYLTRQSLSEAQPAQLRREELSYDTALVRLSKGICPGCERPVDLKLADNDFCPHCGIGLFDHCLPCKTRKSAFSKFCHACGAAPQPAAVARPWSSPAVLPSSNTSPP